MYHSNEKLGEINLIVLIMTLLSLEKYAKHISTFLRLCLYKICQCVHIMQIFIYKKEL